MVFFFLLSSARTLISSAPGRMLPLCLYVLMSPPLAHVCVVLSFSFFFLFGRCKYKPNIYLFVRSPCFFVVTLCFCSRPNSMLGPRNECCLPCYCSRLPALVSTCVCVFLCTANDIRSTSSYQHFEQFSVLLGCTWPRQHPCLSSRISGVLPS